MRSQKKIRTLFIDVATYVKTRSPNTVRLSDSKIWYILLLFQSIPHRIMPSTCQSSCYISFIRFDKRSKIFYFYHAVE